jgi:hypothetical protein
MTVPRRGLLVLAWTSLAAVSAFAADPGDAGRAVLPVLDPASTGLETATGDRAPVRLPGRQVWAHYVPHGLPDFIEGGGAPGYGSLYPLDLVPGGPRAAPRPGSGVLRAQQAGLTGMQILQFEQVNAGSDFVVDWMDQADPTWRDGDRDNDFSIAPCLLVRSTQGAVRMIAQYSAAAAGRPSAARIDGRLVVFVYAPRSLSLDQWRDVRRAVRATGSDVFLVGDLQAESSQHRLRLDENLVAPYLSVFDASWLFDDGTPAIWDEVQGLLSARRQPFAGGVMPGYDRETSWNGGYVDAGGTARLRYEWELALSSGASWTTIVTWNDAVEHTDIKASSDWNHTRQDVTAFYAAKFRGLPPPRPTAELYVTTPTFVRTGEAVGAEGLVLNGSTRTVTVHTMLVDASRRPVGPVTTAAVPPGAAVAATTAAGPDRTVLPGRFLRAVSWIEDATGRVLQAVLSAPVVVYGRTDRPSPMLRRLYYSVPAARALPAQVRLTLTGTPSATAPAMATVTVDPGGGIRFVEVLQNTREVMRGYDVDRLSATVPMSATVITGGQSVSAETSGFYVGRAIDQKERVGYSDPLFVPAPQGR